jgi:hypothetical protein
MVPLFSLQRSKSDHEKPKLVLLEHDNRFGVFPEFSFYDFQQPVKLPGKTRPIALLSYLTNPTVSWTLQ